MRASLNAGSPSIPPSAPFRVFSSLKDTNNSNLHKRPTESSSRQLRAECTAQIFRAGPLHTLNTFNLLIFPTSQKIFPVTGKGWTRGRQKPGRPTPWPSYLAGCRLPRTKAQEQSVSLRAEAPSSLCTWPKLLARLLCEHLQGQRQ